MQNIYQSDDAEIYYQDGMALVVDGDGFVMKAMRLNYSEREITRLRDQLWHPVLFNGRILFAERGRAFQLDMFSIKQIPVYGEALLNNRQITVIGQNIFALSQRGFETGCFSDDGARLEFASLRQFQSARVPSMRLVSSMCCIAGKHLIAVDALQDGALRRIVELDSQTGEEKRCVFVGIVGAFTQHSYHLVSYRCAQDSVVLDCSGPTIKVHFVTDEVTPIISRERRNLIGTVPDHVTMLVAGVNKEEFRHNILQQRSEDLAIHGNGLKRMNLIEFIRGPLPTFKLECPEKYGIVNIYEIPDRMIFYRDRHAIITDNDLNIVSVESVRIPDCLNGFQYDDVDSFIDHIYPLRGQLFFLKNDSVYKLSRFHVELVYKIPEMRCISGYGRMTVVGDRMIIHNEHHMYYLDPDTLQTEVIPLRIGEIDINQREICCFGYAGNAIAVFSCPRSKLMVDLKLFCAGAGKKSIIQHGSIQFENQRGVDLIFGLTDQRSLEIKLVEPQGICKRIVSKSEIPEQLCRFHKGIIISTERSEEYAEQCVQILQQCYQKDGTNSSPKTMQAINGPDSFGRYQYKELIDFVDIFGYTRRHVALLATRATKRWQVGQDEEEESLYSDGSEAFDDIF